MQVSDQQAQGFQKMGTGFINLATALTLALCFILRSYAASHYHHHHHQQQQSAEVKCYVNGENKLRFQKQVKTGQHGSLIRNAKAKETCSLKLARSSLSICSMASPETSAGRLLRRSPGVCNHESRSLLSRKRTRPAFLFPPPIPFLPPPPNIGGIPLPPNPLQPPPSLVPPLPFQPSPPPFSVVPPLPFQPPPPPFSIVPPLPSIPPLPSLVPPPPPPPPAFLFPPLPLPPIFPGHPPAASAQGMNK